MHNPTFDEAVSLWPRLSDGTQPESGHDDALLEVCEAIILDRAIASSNDALIITQVLLDNMQAGPRSDGRDCRALTRLRDWLASLSDHGMALNMR